MDDQTLRRRLSELRIPPADPTATNRALRRALAARTDFPRAEEPASHWTWREWLWPSPLAWSAMAALWIIIAVQATTRPPTNAGHEQFAVQTAAESAQPIAPAFARYDYDALLQELHRGAPLR